MENLHFIYLVNQVKIRLNVNNTIRRKNIIASPRFVVIPHVILCHTCVQCYFRNFLLSLTYFEITILQKLNDYF